MGFVSVHGYCPGELLDDNTQVPTKAQMLWSVIAANELCTLA